MSWIKFAKLARRPPFRRVAGKGKDVGPDRLNDRQVARLVKVPAPDGTMKIDYGRYSPLGTNPNPDWVELEHETVERIISTPDATIAGQSRKKSSFSFMAAPTTNTEAAPVLALPTLSAESKTEEVISRAVVSFDAETRIEVAAKEVRIVHDGETLVANVDGRADPHPHRRVHLRRNFQCSSFATNGCKITHKR